MRKRTKKVNLREAKEIYRRSDHDNDDSCSCFAITPKLAAGRKLNRQQEKLVNVLADGIANQDPLVEQRMFFRGTCAALFSAHLGAGRFVYRPFISATERPLEAIRFLDPDSPALLSVVAPSGCKMLEMSDTVVASVENKEVLFQKDLTLRVDEMTHDRWLSTLKEEDALALKAQPPQLRTRYFAMTIRGFPPSTP
jgi:hypothetical protein